METLLIELKKYLQAILDAATPQLIDKSLHRIDRLNLYWKFENDFFEKGGSKASELFKLVPEHQKRDFINELSNIEKSFMLQFQEIARYNGDYPSIPVTDFRTVLD
jgi:hypothetical protein